MFFNGLFAGFFTSDTRAPVVTLPASTPEQRASVRAAVLQARAESDAEWEEMLNVMTALRQQQREQFDAMLAALTP